MHTELQQEASPGAGSINMHVHEDVQTYTSTTCMYIALAPIQDYVSQESANGSTYQRKYLVTSKVFTESICKSIYISTDFQISEGLGLNFLIIHRGIDYLIITSPLPNNHKKVNCVIACIL